MKVLSSTKNISETYDGYAVIIRIQGDNEHWIASFEEDVDHNLLLDLPIKVLHKVGDSKTVWKSFKEFNLTNEIVKVLDTVLHLWEIAPDETKKVLL